MPNFTNSSRYIYLDKSTYLGIFFKTYFIGSQLHCVECFLVAVPYLTLHTHYHWVSWTLKNDDFYPCLGLSSCSSNSLCWLPPRIIDDLWIKGEKLALSFVLLVCLFLFFSFLFFFFGHTSYGILVPEPGIKPRPQVVDVQSPNHSNTREFPCLLVFSWIWKSSVGGGHSIWSQT